MSLKENRNYPLPITFYQLPGKENDMATIFGTNGDDNNLFGGNDLVGTTGNDDIFGFAGNDELIGDLGDDFLSGGAGNDILNGRAGTDFLDGGSGDDSLFGGDIGVNVPSNILNGGNGDDSLRGGDGDDSLFGGAGNDTLSGVFGVDSLIGGAGNDLYDVFERNNVDTIVEAANGGIDTVESDDSFTLPDNVENLVLKFESGLIGTGNELNNNMTSTTINVILSGLGGNDSLNGGLGNDILSGGDGNDLLIGGSGSDRLLGGTGADRFRFNASNEGIDLITDFVAVDDSIQVSAAGFGGGLNAGAIASGQFRLGSSAADANDRFIYNNNGALFFDPDGTGAAFQVQIATLVGIPTLSAVDIVVI
ncbi:calcium-binding protein [Gloeocapsopsis crepidinum]|nr:calcium-binding protein [Gloeocapsopsis crepidinum]